MRVPVELLVALVAGLEFGLVPAMLQITATMLQRRDKATRLNNPRAELEFLERLNTLHTQFVAGDEDAQRQASIRISEAVTNLLEQYSTLVERDRAAVDGGKPPSQVQPPFFRRVFLLYWPDTTAGRVLHTAFYMLGLVFVTWTSFFAAGGAPPGGYSSWDVTTWVVIAAPLVIGLLIIRGRARRSTVQLDRTAL
jgi:hypothetical protein